MVWLGAACLPEGSHDPPLRGGGLASLSLVRTGAHSLGLLVPKALGRTNVLVVFPSPHLKEQSSKLSTQQPRTDGIASSSTHSTVR